MINLDAFLDRSWAEKCNEEEKYSLQKHINELREELRELHLREEELLEELERLTGDHI